MYTGCISLDNMDEIPLTAFHPLYAFSSRASRNQTDQLDEVLHPEQRPPGSDAEVRIYRRYIRPAHGYRTVGSIWQLHSHPFFPPEPLTNHQTQVSPIKCVTRVNNPNELLSGFTMCI